jgi:hypothetical protein
LTLSSLKSHGLSIERAGLDFLSLHEYIPYARGAVILYFTSPALVHRRVFNICFRWPRSRHEAAKWRPFSFKFSGYIKSRRLMPPTDCILEK